MTDHSDGSEGVISTRRRRGLSRVAWTLLGLGGWLQIDRRPPAPELEEPPPPAIESPSPSFPASASKSGLYAMKGPRGHRQAGEEGRMGAPRAVGRSLDHEPLGGHFLATPYGAAFAVGDDGDVWGGVGASIGVGGLGLVGTGRGGGGTGAGFGGRGLPAKVRLGIPTVAREAMAPTFVRTTEQPLSTFALDVDTAAYSNVRRFLLQDRALPPPEAVRIEELVNYFDYDDPDPVGDDPIAVRSEIGPCPWAPDHRLLRVGVRGRGDTKPRQARNLVFLIDVSGSMASADRLPLAQQALGELVERLAPEDRVSIVTYAGASEVLLAHATVGDRAAVASAIARLSSAGGTNGAAGIQTAYDLAREAFVEGGINRVLLLTDGDFNLGITEPDALVELIEARRRSGVFLSVLGFGRDGFADATMEALADHGNGNYAYLDGIEEARRVLIHQAEQTLTTVAKDVKIQVEIDPARVASYRLIGYENRRLATRDFRDDAKDAGELGAGHTITALYELVPAASGEGDPVAIRVRYQPPEGGVATELVASAPARSEALDQASDDFRFAAAVAAYGLRLRGELERTSVAWSETFELAAGSLGADFDCSRHGFVTLVAAAAVLSGAPLPDLEQVACMPELVEGRSAVEPAAPVEVLVTSIPALAEDTEDETALILEVLRLLPPLLALPLFVLAHRRPRRRD